MSTDALLILLCCVLVADGMQAYSIMKIQSLTGKMGGRIRSRMDLNEVKAFINLNMKMAAVYIGLYVLLIIMLVLMFFGGRRTDAVLVLFLFGIMTLPMGIAGKRFENKIRNLDASALDPALKQRFERYLVQWKEPRLTLSD